MSSLIAGGLDYDSIWPPNDVLRTSRGSAVSPSGCNPDLHTPVFGGQAAPDNGLKDRGFGEPPAEEAAVSKQTALELARADLQREISVLEECKRELEFLEKGGNLLDYNFNNAVLPPLKADNEVEVQERALASSASPECSKDHGVEDMAVEKAEQGVQEIGLPDAGNVDSKQRDGSKTASTSTQGREALDKSVSGNKGASLGGVANGTMDRVGELDSTDKKAGDAPEESGGEYIGQPVTVVRAAEPFLREGVAAGPSGNLEALAEKSDKDLGLQTQSLANGVSTIEERVQVSEAASDHLKASETAPPSVLNPEGNAVAQSPRKSDGQVPAVMQLQDANAQLLQAVQTGASLDGPGIGAAGAKLEVAVPSSSHVQQPISTPPARRSDLNAEATAARARAEMLRVKAELARVEAAQRAQAAAKAAAQKKALAGGGNEARKDSPPVKKQGGAYGVAASGRSEKQEVVLPWTVEEHAVEANQKKKAELSAAARKARENVILELAESVKEQQKRVADWACRKPALEPPVRKAHWDFVLAEMAWLANDFMQERLWKLAAASAAARWAAQAKHLKDQGMTELECQQRRAALGIARLVNDFWVEAKKGQEGSDPMEIDSSPPAPQEVQAAQQEETGGVETVEKPVTGAGHASVLTDAAVDRLKGVEQRSEGTGLEVRGAEPGEASREPTGTGATDMKKDSVLAEAASTCPVTQHKKSNRGVQDYAKRFLQYLDSEVAESTKGAEAPLTPDRPWELDASAWGEQSEELFFYVPEDGMAQARELLAAERREVEAAHEVKVKEHAEALAKAQREADVAEVAAEMKRAGLTMPEPLADSSFEPFDSSFPVDGNEFSDMGRLMSDMPLVDEQLQESQHLDAHPSSGVTKKPRDKKSSKPHRLIEETGDELAHRVKLPVAVAPPAVVTPPKSPTGKRSQPPTPVVVGSIPTKRQRTSAVRKRERPVDGSPLDGPMVSFKSPAGPVKAEPPSEDVHRVLAKPKVTDGTLKVSLKIQKPVHSEPEHVNRSKVQDDRDGRPQGVLRKDVGKHSKGKHSKHDKGHHSEQSRRDRDALPEGDGASKRHHHVPPSMASYRDEVEGLLQTSLKDALKAVKPREKSKDKNKKPKTPASVQPTVWTPLEDQLLVAIVSELGQNWDLVSDVISASLSLKGIHRKPRQCRDRHKALQQLGGGENADAPKTPEAAAAAALSALNLNKMAARALLQRQIPIEDDILKMHLEKIVAFSQKHKIRKQQAEAQIDKSRVTQPHPSHVAAMNAVFDDKPAPSPLELADRQSQPVLPDGLQGVAPLLPGPANTSDPARSAALSAALAARSIRPAISLEEQQRLRQLAAHRQAQHQAAALAAAAAAQAASSAGGGLPGGATAGPLDGSTSTAQGQVGSMGPPPPATSGSLLAARSLQQRAMAVSPPVPGAASGAMLPPAAAATSAVPPPAGGMVVMRKRPTTAAEAIELAKSGRLTEQQRQHILQQLQAQANAGNQTAAAAAAQIAAVGPMHMSAQQHQYLAAQARLARERGLLPQYQAAAQLQQQQQKQLQQQAASEGQLSAQQLAKSMAILGAGGGQLAASQQLGLVSGAGGAQQLAQVAAAQAQQQKLQQQHLAHQQQVQAARQRGAQLQAATAQASLPAQGPQWKPTPAMAPGVYSLARPSAPPASVPSPGGVQNAVPSLGALGGPKQQLGGTRLFVSGQRGGPGGSPSQQPSSSQQPSQRPSSAGSGGGAVSTSSGGSGGATGLGSGPAVGGVAGPPPSPGAFTPQQQQLLQQQRQSQLAQQAAQLAAQSKAQPQTPAKPSQPPKPAAQPGVPPPPKPSNQGPPPQQPKPQGQTPPQLGKPTPPKPNLQPQAQTSGQVRQGGGGAQGGPSTPPGQQRGWSTPPQPSQAPVRPGGGAQGQRPASPLGSGSAQAQAGQVAPPIAGASGATPLGAGKGVKQGGGAPPPPLGGKGGQNPPQVRPQGQGYRPPPSGPPLQGGGGQRPLAPVLRPQAPVGGSGLRVQSLGTTPSPLRPPVPGSGQPASSAPPVVEDDKQ